MTALRTRVLLAIALPAVVLLVVLSAIVWLRVRADRLADLDASLAARAEALAALAERDHGEWEIDPVPPGLLGGAVWWEVRVAPDGPVLASGGARRDGPARTWSGTLDAATDDGPDEPGETEQPDEPRGPARVRIDIADDLVPLTRDLRDLLAVLGGAGAALAALAVLLGSWLSRRLVDPLEHERLHDAWLRQARFTADASHELRTPLAVVRSQAEVALRRERTVAEYQQALASVVEGAGRMQETLDALLVLARADTGEGITAEVVDLADLAREGVATVEVPEAVAMRLEAPDATPVRGDARLLATALRNLLTNAVRHTATGEIGVRVGRRDGRATLEVRDTGEGIPPDALAHVFERFWRADEARGRERGGAGLGLAIVKAVVDRHGGTVAATSQVGVGSVFTITLPLHEVRPT